MADKTLADLLQLATDESTVDDSVIALVNSLKSQVADLLSGTTVGPDVQAKINSVFDTVTANKEKVAAAVLANTPQANV